ncbi:hypothetical protein U1Q18_014839 [Sarracenia purpurea var. burkii]
MSSSTITKRLPRHQMATKHSSKSIYQSAQLLKHLRGNSKAKENEKTIVRSQQPARCYNLEQQEKTTIDKGTKRAIRHGQPQCSNAITIIRQSETSSFWSGPSGI